MTRRAIFTTLFSSGFFAGAAKAQKHLDPDLGSHLEEFNQAVRALDPKVPNGMCPVCGTEAKKIEGNIATGECESIRSRFLHCKESKPVITTVVRCSKCNAAFYQDSE